MNLDLETYCHKNVSIGIKTLQVSIFFFFNFYSLQLNNATTKLFSDSLYRDIKNESYVMNNMHLWINACESSIELTRLEKSPLRKCEGENRLRTWIIHKIETNSRGELWPKGYWEGEGYQTWNNHKTEKRLIRIYHSSSYIRYIK